jgi:hypothetical protein
LKEIWFRRLDLTPALSSRRGRIIGRPLETPVTELAGGAPAKPEACDILFTEGRLEFFGARRHPGPLLPPSPGGYGGTSQERENHPPSHRKSTRLDLPDAHSQHQRRATFVPSPWGRRLG